ncbi:MAG: hypothetical protein U0838_14375 [Chloroflexota bacterium]
MHRVDEDAELGAQLVEARDEVEPATRHREVHQGNAGPEPVEHEATSSSLVV